MIDGRTKAVVSKGKTTSNATIKWWMRKIKGIPQNSKDMISLADINSATYAPMITGRTPIPNGKQTSYERNRNLFYVCCSRPRKRLFFFVSVPIDASFRVFLDDLVGAENIYTYGQYLEAKQ